MSANTSLANGTHYLDEVREMMQHLCLDGYLVYFQFVYLFQDYLHDIVLSETKSVSPFAVLLGRD